jgi:eukaryotic-like serine/threonine-protein kinase
MDRRIGSYRLLRQLMSGQNSQVWEVMHDGKQQRFALKTLHDDLRRDKEQIGYLKNEYFVGNLLDHKRVVKIHEMGSAGGMPFLVLEFYPHPNMKTMIQQDYDRFAPLIPKVIEQSAEALSYFHSKGWVHRDIKPDNFLVSPEGEVKLIDFALALKRKTGIAKLFAGKTKCQGTRSYMSPEQIRGQALDHRADIYSFGCMLQEMLTGKPPFTGSDTTELLNKHLRSMPPPIEVANKNVTREFARLVQHTLAKEPSNRPESMEKFLTEFRSVRVYKEPPRPSRRRDNDE